LETIQGQIAQPFRQFSEITMVVEDMVQVVALNVANSVFSSCDIVAMRPKNQKKFNQTCTHLEVKRQKS
jgi:ribonuclease P/MRP protein subunit RPP1